MFKMITLEAKTPEEALLEASKALLVLPDKLKFEVVEEKKNLIGMKKSTVYDVFVNVDLAFEGKKYIENIILALGIDCVMEMKKTSPTEIDYRILSDNNAILIGRNGQTLTALQKLLKSYLLSFVDVELQVSLDVGNYNQKRIRQLEILATQTAKTVIKTKTEVHLDSLTSFERRIIHAKLADWRDITTTSIDVADKRVLVIKQVIRKAI